MPLSLLEAMFLEKICIVSDCIGNRDVINSKNGFVCKNEEEFIDVLKNLRNIDYESLIKNGKNDIYETFNLEKMSYEYRKLYEK